jgi:hypothetical protein
VVVDLPGRQQIFQLLQSCERAASKRLGVHPDFLEQFMQLLRSAMRIPLAAEIRQMLSNLFE